MLSIKFGLSVWSFYVPNIHEMNIFEEKKKKKIKFTVKIFSVRMFNDLLTDAEQRLDVLLS